jgi:hypothetical protein
MRDNHDGYPELLDAYERDGFYFGAVRVTVAGEVAAFEFGVEQRGCVSLKQILHTLPFDPLGKHRHFFKGTSANVSLTRIRSALAFALSKGQMERASILRGLSHLSRICCGFSP